MDGRPPLDNRACVNCISKLSPSEVCQVNWHVDPDNACRLCAVRDLKPEAFTKPFCDFLRENPTVFHTVEYFKTKLRQSGYVELPARDSWADKIQPGGKYWVTRNGSSLIAFAVGKSYKPGNGEFITAGRIDDKLCSWSALLGLLHSTERDSDSYIKLVALFDDEEVGSLLRQGARGNFLPLTVERAVEALNPSTYGPGLIGQTYAKSFLLSADVSHAGHPNFLGNYLPEHIPKLNVGLVVCSDSNAHMTTDAVSSAILHRVADLCGATLQDFQIRNDSRSGGTVGPMLSSAMGVRGIDAGLPQLSMHSIRATTGALDPGLGVQLFKGFLDHWEQVDGEWE
ncbi:peptidase M18, aminopeptidase I [Trichoderma longibrachiatum ATCC 18648]|uniref:Peptidase M18, aminopeptidase I n=1 Tax=Trichoderma longibrachiatum ATCC 18648 TaxID=983965 RepID=A0A2T4CA77_TRILO|nr:peptidase M18, aminopeptidase I [Trichoderma longibrachiatum ATCC 18648]